MATQRRAFLKVREDVSSFASVAYELHRITGANAAPVRAPIEVPRSAQHRRSAARRDSNEDEDSLDGYLQDSAPRQLQRLVGRPRQPARFPTAIYRRLCQQHSRIRSPI
jgi:hypothetical protein